jgi:hypothetical protein
MSLVVFRRSGSSQKWQVLGLHRCEGDFVISPRFEYAQGFSEGLAVVLVDGKHGVIDKTEVLLTNPFDDSGWSLSDGLLEVERGDQWGYVDIHGRVAVPIQFHQASGFAEGLAAVEFSERKDQGGFIDHHGRVVILPQFQEAGYFSEGMAPVEIDFKYGYTDKRGNVVIKELFDHAYSFSEGLGLVILDKKYGFINSSGQFVVHPKYDLSFPFRNGLAAVSYGKWQPGEGSDFAGPSYDGNWGYIDKVGNEVREFSR